MREFFSSKRFKILLGVLVVLGAFMLRAAWTGGFGTLVSSTLGAVLTPIQSVTASMSDAVAGFFGTFTQAGAIQNENEQLKEEIAALNQKLVDYDAVKHQNEVYKDFLGIKDRSPDLEFVPAQVSGRDASARFSSFNIDRGAMDGVSLRASVITAEGMVGVITEVGYTYAQISTILDPSVNIAVYDTRTRDTGVLSGDIGLAERGLCKLSYLPRESGVAVGDLIATSGASGRYPRDLIIGKVVEVLPENHGNSLYAVIQPTADVRSVQDVLVIQSFAGQTTQAAATVGGMGANAGGAAQDGVPSRTPPAASSSQPTEQESAAASRAASEEASSAASGEGTA